MTTARRRFVSMRSILELPILTGKFLSKVPTVIVEAIMIDLDTGHNLPRKCAEAPAIIDNNSSPRANP